MPETTEVRDKLRIEDGKLHLDLTDGYHLEWTPDQADQFAKALLVTANRARGLQGHMFIVPVTEPIK